MKVNSCLIIGFLREDGVIRIIRSAELAGIKKFYLSIDGSRNQHEMDIQERLLESVELITAELNLEVHVWQRKINQGIAVSVITAVDWYFQNEERGIILEDDLSPHQDFFAFVNDALEFFEKDPTVWVISGNQFFPSSENSIENSWSTYPLIWGWATWRIKWKEMREEIIDSDFTIPSTYPTRVRNFLKVGRDRSISGAVDSWAILLAAKMCASTRYCLLPPVNLVANFGVDSVAVHTRGNMLQTSQVTHPLAGNFKFSSQMRAEVSEKIDRKIEASLYGVSLRHIFLPFYAPFTKFSRNRKKIMRRPLNERLLSIDLPR